MTLYSLTQAIDVALAFLKAKKLCHAVEDDEAYYITMCSDSGEPIHAPCTCRVDKKSLNVRMCYFNDPAWKKPKTEIQFPAERLDCYVPYEEVQEKRWRNS